MPLMKAVKVTWKINILSNDMLLHYLSQIEFSLILESSRLELFLENVNPNNYLVVVVADDGSTR